MGCSPRGVRRLEFRRFKTRGKRDWVNSHKNASLTIDVRELLIERFGSRERTAAAKVAAVSSRIARKWLGRFEDEGLNGLRDRSSRSSRTRSTDDSALERSIKRLWRLRIPMQCVSDLADRTVETSSWDNSTLRFERALRKTISRQTPLAA